MTREDAFIADIIANPADDAVRLIYADWLDGQGREEYGEFIRVQVELARMGNYCQCDYEVGIFYCEWCNARRPIQAREMRLFSPDWLPDFDGQLREWFYGKYPSDYRQYNPFSFCVSRGFISEVHLSCQDWITHGPALVRRQPIERVVLVDRKPYYNAAGAWIWVMTEGLGHPESAALPKPLYKSLYGFSDVISYIRGYSAAYHTESSALAALSAASLLWARQTEPATARA